MSPELDLRAEQAAFDAWLKSLGRPAKRHYHRKTWAGEKSLMPTYLDSWTEAQWGGWLARATRIVPSPQLPASPTGGTAA